MYWWAWQMCAFNISYCVEVVPLVLKINACIMCDCLNDELLGMVQFGDQYLVLPQICTHDTQMNDVYYTWLLWWCIIGHNKMSKIKYWFYNEYATLILRQMLCTVLDCFNGAICEGNSELGSMLLMQSMAQSGSEELCNHINHFCSW